MASPLWLSSSMVQPADTEGTRRLLDAFSDLLDIPTDEGRMRWIEDRVFSVSDFPAPDRPVDWVRAELTRIWLQIYDRLNARPAPESPACEPFFHPECPAQG